MEFPFLWGAATSSHQVEGYNYFNDWWAWEQAGRTAEPSGAACDQYHRFPQDLELITSLGHNAHRFSIEWSRLEPQENRWDQAALDHYVEMARLLRERSIEPIVTLHHFTNPQWFADMGGWLSHNTVYYFERYVEKVVKALSPYVNIWITLNEPMVYLYHSFYAGLWPPGIKSFMDSMKVFRNLLRAHVAAYEIIHHIYRAELNRRPWVSIAKHMTHFRPCNPFSPLDHLAVHLRRSFFNHLFLKALHYGSLRYPGLFFESLKIRKTLDFIGVNYYTINYIKYAGWSGARSMGITCEEAHHDPQEKNMMGWTVDAGGLYHVLLELKPYGLPVMICENGICSLDDEQRVRFIQNHVAAVRRAMNHSVKVAGFLYWSLLDNFEWAHGFAPRFGIIEVDFKSQRRKMRRSAQVLSDLCRNITSHA